MVERTTKVGIELYEEVADLMISHNIQDSLVIQCDLLFVTNNDIQCNLQYMSQLHILSMGA